MLPPRLRGLLLALLCAVASSLCAGQNEARSLSVGWYPWDPYSYAEETIGNYRHLTGLDIELLRAAMQLAGQDLLFVPRLWEDQMQAIADGSQDLAMGALVSDSITPELQFSQPYRRERISLYHASGYRALRDAHSLEELLQQLQHSQFRLGVSAGYSYGAEVDAFIADPANAAQLVIANSEYELFHLLQQGRIDGFVADQLVAATVGWRLGMLSLIRQHPVLLASNEVRLMFSQQVPPSVVEGFNAAIEALRDKGEYQKIIRHYLMPLLLAETVERPWFSIMNVVATFALAVSGVILAYSGRFSVFGAFVLASLPAVGGGVIRDVVAGRRPIGLLQNPELLLYSGLTVLLGWLVIRHWPRPHPAAPGIAAEPIPAWFGWTVTVCDAIGLGALTVAGVMVAMQTRSEPLLLWGPLLAVVTNVGGGIMRDLVYGSGLSTLKGSLYAEIAIVWGGLLSLFFYWQVSRIELNEIMVAVLLCSGGACLTRIFVVARRISAPMLVPARPDAQAR
jgi:polar amino acid transport system substrate-binding protein